jgi:hypothetical protein
MTTSKSSPNIFLFTDRNVGELHGYRDGWLEDVFHYTGKGQRGDQKMNDINVALLSHELTERSVRLFRGVGGTVTYLGEFRVDDKHPYYKMDAPETGGGPTRQVIVFRLLPVGSVVKDAQDEMDAGAVLLEDIAAAVESGTPVVKLVPIEAQYTEESLVNPSGESHVARRQEQTLVIAYRRYLERRGSKVSRYRIHPAGEARPLLSDLYDETRKNLIEAKSTGSRGAVRTAIGQLADYGRFAEEGTASAVLLPDRPRPDLEELLRSQSLFAVWATGRSFEDNADGRFV